MTAYDSTVTINQYRIEKVEMLYRLRDLLDLLRGVCACIFLRGLSWEIDTCSN
jgi:hypothetical protein